MYTSECTDSSGARSVFLLECGVVSYEALALSGFDVLFSAMAVIMAPWRRINLHHGLGAPNGPRTAAFDRWFRYPAGFGRDTLAACFDAIDARRGALVVDPFAGVSTTGVAACARGLTFAGIEAHPLVAELAALKFARPSDPDELLLRARAIANEASRGETTSEHPLVVRSFTPDTL